jgi:putative flippase GtrA
MLNWSDLHRTLAQLKDFVAAGLVNTGLTFVVYEVLLLVTNYRLAYAAAFVVGLVAATMMNVRMVFGKALTLNSLSRYGLYYCGYCALSLIVATVAVEDFGVPAAWAPVPVLLLLTGPHFLASRRLAAGTAGVGE